MSSTITIGTAPDSWGVWFPSDPEQVAPEVFLREVAEAGYEWIELGPYGYLPSDPVKLRDQLDEYGLGVLAGTVFEHLHQTRFMGCGMDAGHRRGRADASDRGKAHRRYP